MANMRNIAYPYTKAIFEMAKDNNSIDLWLEYLNNLAACSKNSDFVNIVGNPRVSKDEIIKILMSSLGFTTDSVVSIELENVLRLLQENNRILALSDIYDLFVELVSEDRKISTAVIQTAFAISDIKRQQLEKSLSEKFAKKITAIIEVKPELIGGIKIMVNDIVIDSSIKGSLENMAAQLIR